jgi:ATP/maltotriose-dependent transcriptional regulator MalT
VLELLATGLSNTEIAARLVVTVGTVKTYIKGIYGKLAVHSRTQAILRARELGLL